MDNNQSNSQLQYLKERRKRFENSLQILQILYIKSVTRCHLAVEDFRCDQSTSIEQRYKRAQSLDSLLDRKEFKYLSQTLKDAATAVILEERAICTEY